MLMLFFFSLGLYDVVIMQSLLFLFVLIQFVVVMVVYEYVLNCVNKEMVVCFVELLQKIIDQECLVYYCDLVSYVYCV